MPFSVRQIATTAAILVFFITAAIGTFYECSPFTVCKRALLTMLIAYVAVTFIVKIINVIVLDAMITKQVNKRLNRKT